MHPPRPLAALCVAVLVAAGCSSGGSPAPATAPLTPGPTSPAATSSTLTTSNPATRPPTTPATTRKSPAGVPRFDHIVVAMLENHSYDEILGGTSAPFLASLAASGAVLTQSFAITHPSEPNYLALFSGSTQGLTDDSCPRQYTGPNLAASLIAAGLSFTGYSEDLPAPGFTRCSNGAYARKHNPWVDFSSLPSKINQPMTAFPRNFAALPTVSFVIPNLDHDMHDAHEGTIAAGDQWLQSHLGGYAAWAKAHNSLLIITTDEDDSHGDNQIATVVVGAHVRPGAYSKRVDHYGLLRTLLDSYRLAPFARAAGAAPLSVWTG